jgi:hypothetical protein
MKASKNTPKRPAKNAPNPQHKVQDLVPKKDARGGELSLSYGKIKYDYHQP